MSRLTLVLVALVGILAGGLGTALLYRPEPETDGAAVRAIVSEVLAEREAVAAQAIEEQAPQADIAQVDAGMINPIIEDYLMSNPRILQRMSDALEVEVRTAETAAAREAIASMRETIFNDPDQIVLGNPDGDVTLVELFDYNCSYCRTSLPDIATLIDEDPELRVVLKEFPILSAESLDAARVAVLVNQSDADYWDFHEKLFTARGQVTQETALEAAVDLGLSRPSLELAMNSERVNAVIEKSYSIARALNITGTPSFIIGDEVIAGAVGVEELRDRIANMRACGKTACDATAAEIALPAPDEG